MYLYGLLNKSQPLVVDHLQDYVESIDSVVFLGAIVSTNSYEYYPRIQLKEKRRIEHNIISHGSALAFNATSAAYMIVYTAYIPAHVCTRDCYSNTNL